VAPRNKSKSTTAPGQRTNQPTSPAARPKYQQSPREVRRRVFPSDIDPSPSCPTPSIPNRPQPAAGHVTPWTSCYAPPPPTRVIVPASAEHQAAHNATRSRDPRATIGHNKNARRGGGVRGVLPRGAATVALARVAELTAHQLPTNNKCNNNPTIQ